MGKLLSDEEVFGAGAAPTLMSDEEVFGGAVVNESNPAKTPKLIDRVVSAVTPDSGTSTGTITGAAMRHAANAVKTALTPAPSVADRAVALSNSDQAAPQVPGVPVRQGYYNNVLAQTNAADLSAQEDPAGIAQHVRVAAANDQQGQSGKQAVGEVLSSQQSENQLARQRSDKLKADYFAEQADGGPSLLDDARDVGLGVAGGTMRLPGQVSAIGEALPIIGPAITEVKDYLAGNLPAWANPTAVADHMAQTMTTATTRMASQKASQAAQSAEEEAKKGGSGAFGQIAASAKGAAEGVWDNPRSMLPMIAENLPQMVAISKVVSMAIAGDAAKLDGLVKAGTLTEEAANRQLVNLATRYSALGEGLITSGQVEQGILHDNPEANALERAAALPAGAITALISRGVSKIPGLGDVEASIAMANIGKKAGFAGSLPVRAAKGFLSEGVLQESTQSAQEQAWQNLGSRKPWQEGVGEQAVQGIATGGVLGAGGAALAGRPKSGIDDLGHALSESVDKTDFTRRRIDEAAIRAMRANPGTDFTEPARSASAEDILAEGQIPVARPETTSEAVTRIINAGKMRAQQIAAGVPFDYSNISSMRTEAVNVGRNEPVHGGLDITPTESRNIEPVGGDATGILGHDDRPVAGEPVARTGGAAEPVPGIGQSQPVSDARNGAVTQINQPQQEQPNAQTSQAEQSQTQQSTTNPQVINQQTGVQNAIQKPSAESVLPYSQEGVGKAGGERIGMGQGQQGQNSSPEGSGIYRESPPQESAQVADTIRQNIEELIKRRSVAKQFNLSTHLDIAIHKAKEAIKSGTGKAANFTKIAKAFKGKDEQIYTSLTNLANAIEPVKIATLKQQKIAQSLIPRIRQLGGINLSFLRDITGESNVRKSGAVGLFSNNGRGLDDLATMLADEGFPINMGDEADNGGVNNLAELIRYALGGGEVLTNSAREAKLAAGHEAEHKGEIRKQAKELGIKTVGRKFSDIEAKVIRLIEGEQAREEGAITDAEYEALDERVMYLQDRIGEEGISAIYSDISKVYGDKSVRAFHEALSKRIEEAIHEYEARSAGEVQQAVSGEQGKGDAAGRATAGAGGNEEAHRKAPILSSYTNEEVTKRERAQAGQEAAKRADEAQVKKDQAAKDKADLEARAKAHAENPDNFQFGESSKDSVKPMGDIFHSAVDQRFVPLSKRGEVGASLTKEQRKDVLKTLVDVYRANKVPKEQKGIDANGNEYFGYVHSPEYFVKSDITGKMVRYHITLPDGRIAHPTELFADYTQTDIDAAMQKQIDDERIQEQNDKSRLETLQRRTSDTLNDANRKFNSENRGRLDYVPAILTDGKQFIRTPEEMVERDLKLLGEGWHKQETDQPVPQPAAESKPSQPAQAEQPAEAKPQGKIEDFGRKISGAKKEYTAAYKDRMAEAKKMDVLAQPLSKSWPEPDYQKLVDSGYDKNIVGLVRSMRDEIPNKPGKTWKQKTWAKQVELLRDTADKLLNDQDFAEKFVEGMKKEKHLKLDDAINGRAELYALLGHEKSLKGIRITRSQYGVFNGVAFNPPKIIWEVTKDAKATAFGNMPKTLGSGETRQAAIESFTKAYSTLDTNNEKDNKTKFELYADRHAKPDAKGQYFIGKKVGRNVIHIKDGFDTVKEARAYMAEHNDELTAILEQKKEIPHERYDTNKPRVGQDMRNAQDVTPQMFADAFGFFGVQFGNYVEGARRQKDLNDAYDALMDLAAVLDIPPKALSLNGELGLAFGARGTGGKHPASAHYEHGQVVINLTKGNGAGSLAHEFWHSLDNYFSRMAGKKDDFATDRSDVSLAARGAAYQFTDDGIRKEMIEAFGVVVKAINSTAMRQRSSSLDSRRTKKYWGTGIEMSARSFERYVIAKLHDNGFANDYLANVVSEEYWNAADALGIGEGGSYPYPTESELPAIRAGFDKFFQTIETKETDKGIALRSMRGENAAYEIDPKTSQPISQQEAGRVREGIAELARVLGENAKRPAPGMEPILEQDAKMRELAVQVKHLFGRDVFFYRSSDDLAGGGLFLTSRPDSIALNLNGGLSLWSVAGHELLHSLKQNSPGAYKALEAGILRLLKNRQKYADMLGAEHVAAGLAAPAESLVREELMADVAGQLFWDKQFWKDFAAHSQPGFVKRVMLQIRRWIDGVLGKISKTTDNEFLNQYVHDIDRVRNAMAKAFAEYAKEKGITIKSEEQVLMMVAWHGSPHDHDKFDSSKIGTGEGAQAYGHGLYFAGSKEVAEWYKNKLSGLSLEMNGQRLSPAAWEPSNTAEDMAKANAVGRLLGALKNINVKYLDGNGIAASAKSLASGAEEDARLYNDPAASRREAMISDQLHQFADAAKSGDLVARKGRLYQVELAPAEDDYLLWDKPLSEQSEKVKAALVNAELAHPDGMSKGKDYYYRLSDNLNSDKAASEYLHSLGIRGIKYLDGSSRSKGDGNFNYVIFSDKDVDITAKFSKAQIGKLAHNNSYEVQPDTARNLPIDGATLVELRRAAAGIEDAERGITFTVNADGKAIVTGPARVKVPARFRRFANEHGLTLVVQRSMAGSGYANANTAMPLENREAGALYFGEMGTDQIDLTGSTQFSNSVEQNPTPQTVDSVKKATAVLRARWLGLRKIKIVQSIEQLPEELRQRAMRSGGIASDTEGVYDPKTNTVYLVADNIATPERAVWVAVHEVVGHGGIRMLGVYVATALNHAAKNGFVTKLAKAIAADRGEAFDAKEHIDEAVAELSAATITGDVDAILERYGVKVPSSMRNNLLGMIKRVVDAVRQFIGRVTGKSAEEVSDGEVLGLIRRMKGAVEGVEQGYYTAGVSNEVMASRDEMTGKRFARIVAEEFTAENDAAFIHNVSAGKSLDSVLNDIADSEYHGEHTRVDERDESSADHRYVFTTSDGTTFYVYETDAGRVWIDVSRLKPGSGGQAIYAAVANYAYNSHKVFGGDPAGLSESAMIRRTSNMLSSALRFGTTRHLDAAKEQIDGDLANGIEPLDWRGSDIDKVEALVHTFVATMQKRYPAIKSLYYDFESKTFRDGKGEPFSPAALSAIRQDDGRRVDESQRLGEATARRAVFLQTLVDSSGKGVGERSGILEQVLRWGNSSSPESLNGLFSRAPAQSRFTLPEETALRKAQRMAQDQQIRWDVVQNAIKEQGGIVNSDNDVFLALKLYPGRVAAAFDAFQRQVLEPLLERTAASKIHTDEIAEYLYAQHAPERNAQIALINPKFTDGGSGMTDEEAARIMSEFEARPDFKTLQSLADDFQRITDRTLTMLVGFGVFSQEHVDAYRNTYQNYVPLKGFEQIDEDGKQLPGTGLGHSTARSIGKRAKGRSSRAGQIIENIVRDHEIAIIAAEKANIGRRVRKFVEDNPDDALWTVEKAPLQAVLTKGKTQTATEYEITYHGSVVDVRRNRQDAKEMSDLLNLKDPGSATVRPVQTQTEAAHPNGLVSMRAMTFDAEKEIQFIENDKAVRIQLHDPLLVRAYNKLGMDGMGKLFEVSATFNSFLRQMYTQKNPAFFLINPIRDVQGLSVSLTGYAGLKVMANAFKHWPGAWLALQRYSLQEKHSTGHNGALSSVVGAVVGGIAGGVPGAAIGAAMGSSIARSESSIFGTDAKDWQTWIDMFKANGGAVGFAWVGDIQQKQERIDHLLERIGGVGVIEAMQRGQYKKGVKRMLFRTLNNEIFDMIEHLNYAFENASRLSAFRAAVEGGVEPREAARIAKNVTTNFNDKGEVGGEFNALYLFANANIQGTANIARVLSGKLSKNKGKVWAMVGAIVAMGLVAGMGDDDEDKDLVPDYENQRFWHIDLGAGRRITIPKPYGWSFFHDLGRAMAHTTKDHSSKAVLKESLAVASSFLGNFSPVNVMPQAELNAKDAVVGAMPTMIKPLVQVATNRTGMGSPLMPERERKPNQPDSEKAWRKTRGGVYDAMAKGMNKATGGDVATSGTVDVSPETLKMIATFLTGGAGRFTSDTVSSALEFSADGEVKASKLPIVRQFYRENDVDAYLRRFYDQADEAKKQTERFATYSKNHDIAGIKKLRSEDGAMLKAGYTAPAIIAGAIADLRNQEETITANEKLSRADKKQRIEAIDRKVISLTRKFDSTYKKAWLADAKRQSQPLP